MPAYRIADGLASKDSRRSELIFRMERRGLTDPEVAEFERLDRELFAHIRQKYPGCLEVRRVPDGLVFRNLEPGIYLVAGESYGELDRMNRDGGLWPYALRFWDYFHTTDMYVVGIEEG